MTKRNIRMALGATVTCLAAGFLSACGDGGDAAATPSPGPAAAPDAAVDAPARDAAPAPDAGPRPDAAPCPAPSAGAGPDYPAGPYGIGHCETVAQVTFKRHDDTAISLAEIRAMPAVRVLLIVESAKATGNEKYVAALNPVYDELQASGVFMMAVLVDPDASAQTLLEWEAATQFKGVSVYGSRIAGRGGITSGTPGAYVLHAGTMQIQTRLVGFAAVNTQALRTAALQALASAPP